MSHFLPITLDLRVTFGGWRGGAKGPPYDGTWKIADAAEGMSMPLSAHIPSTAAAPETLSEAQTGRQVGL